MNIEKLIAEKIKESLVNDVADLFNTLDDCYRRLDRGELQMKIAKQGLLDCAEKFRPYFLESDADNLQIYKDLKKMKSEEIAK